MDDKLIISLIGMTGCGKSTVGKIAANKLNLPFFDLDVAIKDGEKREISEIFANDGELAFRQIEAVYLEKIINQAEDGTVIACGGGAPMFEATRKILQEKTYNVWIKRDPDSVLMSQEVLMRPPISGEKSKYYELLSVREDIYRSTAEIVLENNDPELCANELCNELSKIRKREEK